MKPRILFVDDEPNILDGLRRMLRGFRGEWDMAFAIGGRAALDELSRQPVDIIVSDMRMPDIDGTALLKEVRSKYPNVIRMVLSGQCDTKSVYHIVGSCHQFLSKPCDTEALAKAVRRTLALRNLIHNDRLRQRLAGQTGLSAPSQTYRRLIELLNADCQSAKEVSALIVSDLALSAKILQLANSGYFGAARSMTSPDQAINFLGLDTISALVLSHGVLSELDVDRLPPRIYRDISMRGRTCARIARDIASAEGLDQHAAGHAYVAGLLCEIGILVLADGPSADYERIYWQARESGVRLRELELESLGDSHDIAGAYLLTLWGFPSGVVDAVAFCDTPRQAHGHSFDVLSVLHIAHGLLSTEPGQIESRGLLDRLDCDYLKDINAMAVAERCAKSYAASRAVAS